MNWWADLGGWLGRGVSWTPLDFAVFVVAFPLFVVLAVWLGRKSMWRQWEMDVPYERRTRSKR